VSGDFDYRVLNVTAHRPWPMPASPWVMTQTWHDLLFAHWPVDAAMLREKIPPGFELDVFDGQAWVAVVPFRMSNVAPRGVPSLPWVSAFPELNVRTYVRVNDTPGVYFFSLDAGSAVAVATARVLAHLPYYTADMRVEPADGWIRYRSRRVASGAPPAEFAARYRPLGDAQPPSEGTLEYFLTERYCLFTLDAEFHALRLDIHHPPWLLQGAEADVTVNTMTEACDIRLPAMKPLLYFARRQDMVAWTPHGVDSVKEKGRR